MRTGGRRSEASYAASAAETKLLRLLREEGDVGCDDGRLIAAVPARGRAGSCSDAASSDQWRAGKVGRW